MIAITWQAWHLSSLRAKRGNPDFGACAGLPRRYAPRNDERLHAFVPSCELISERLGALRTFLISHEDTKARRKKGRASTSSARTAWLSFLFLVSIPDVAHACGDPSEKWYFDVSDVVFDGSARCEPDKRTCRIRVTRVLKIPAHLSLGGRPIDVDYQNWFEDNYDPNTIIITCGVPVFEPELRRFRARFYANLDKKTSELVVRTHRLKGADAAKQETK